MPWRETCPMEERKRFIEEFFERERSMSELCRRYGISRKTGYKMVARFSEFGVAGLSDLSRAPHRRPWAISPEVEQRIVALRAEHRHWGPRKLRWKLEQLEPGRVWPAASSIGELLKRRGLVKARRHRPPALAQTPFGDLDGPNATWCADFKGWFRTGDGRRCDPLTLMDAFSRYLLRCQAVMRPDYGGVQPWFERAFEEYGLPRAIRTDNGPPFATQGLAGLSRLSVWWTKLGIRHERIAPGHPEQNPRHERMHRTLKEATATPPASTIAAQQRAFDQFLLEYNEQRPHESLCGRAPAMVYGPSPRPYPSRLPEIEYPAGGELRRVRHNGVIRWRHRELFISLVLRGETVRLEAISERYWKIYFGSVELAALDDWRQRILSPTSTRISKLLPMSPV